MAANKASTNIRVLVRKRMLEEIVSGLALVREGGKGEAYRLVTRGTRLPVLWASTRRMTGRMQRRLWWVENEVSQETERL